MIERRSYDPFGQRRNPVWGERVPASFSSETTQGFTGHESDDELGLVNLKGRIYDPRIGRFLTTDPIVSIPAFGQRWKPYTYVLNNPLAYVDPGGFQQAPPEDDRHARPYRRIVSVLRAQEGPQFPLPLVRRCSWSRAWRSASRRCPRSPGRPTSAPAFRFDDQKAVIRRLQEL
ncbi:RHS repeat-associated core domain-containing protein [Sorangium sp. So ce1014]|uniref:RHS repeat domain-containing protein n=1 Tax=Sorangium sp. So ce1014 TaxID=3133326 RepID=UPI003F5F538A